MIEAIESDGQNVTPWAVQARLGGGDFLHIQQVIDQFYTDLKLQAEAEKELEEIEAEIAKEPKKEVKEPAPQINEVPAEEILPEDMPADIAASMYHMQTTLGQMANQLWNEADKKVRGKLALAQKKQSQLEQARDEALITNQQLQSTIDELSGEVTQLNEQAKDMALDNDQQLQSTIDQLNSEVAQLKEEHASTTKTLITEKKALQESLQEAVIQKEGLQSNVAQLEALNRDLEQQVFSANIEKAKAEGITDILKEQLDLAKQSEKKLQKNLDKSEKSVNELNRELRDEMRERYTPPEPSNTNSFPIETEPFEIPTSEKQQPFPTANNAKNNSHDLQIKRAKRSVNPKTRTLSDKLFDRKKHSHKN